MNVKQAVLMLQGFGYRFAVQDGKIKWALSSGEPPPEASIFFETLRKNKAEAIQIIYETEASFIEIPPECGEKRKVDFDSSDEGSLKRWAMALHAGLIALDGKSKIGRNSGIVHLCYRCTFPDEWLQEAITAACERQYNALLERIRAGENWIRENGEHPSYERYYQAYIKLFEDLRLLYCAINKSLQDPMNGYVERNDRYVTG